MVPADWPVNLLKTRKVVSLIEDVIMLSVKVAEIFVETGTLSSFLVGDID